MADHVLLVADRGFEQLITEAGVTLIGYRQLRDAMRGNQPMSLSATRLRRFEKADPYRVILLGRRVRVRCGGRWSGRGDAASLGRGGADQSENSESGSVRADPG